MTDRTQAMTGLAPGCCSASLPCNFQKEFPRLICDSCQIVSLSSQLAESRKLCAADVGAILTLKARIAELEANEKAYEEIIGKKTYQEVADELASCRACREKIDCISRDWNYTGPGLLGPSCKD